MIVLKFGGTSVANAECIRRVQSIVECGGGCVVVVSAMSGVTDMLLQTYRQAAEGRAYQEQTDAIAQRHLQAARELIPLRRQAGALAEIEAMAAELSDCLRQTAIERIFSGKTQDYVLSFGERMNSYLISKTIVDAQWADARPLIKTDSRFGNAQVDLTETYRLCKAALARTEGRAVMAGFIASSEDGTTTTLGRGGSDYTAAIVAAALNADALEIWTDADGFMTADPRRIPQARTIPQMTYAEAFELAKFGAKVVYPPTVYPLLMSGIPMYIKNTFNPRCAGTLVCAAKPPQAQPVASVSAIDRAVVFALQTGTGADAQDIAERTQAALAEAQIEPIHIECSAQECWLAAAEADEGIAQIALERTFRSELEQKAVCIEVQRNLSLIAAVGGGVSAEPRLAAQMHSILGGRGIRTLRAAQGLSGLSVLLAVPQNERSQAVEAIHSHFCRT